MREVNPYFLDDILSPLAGGADFDELMYLQHLDANNEQEIKEILKEFLGPYFEGLSDIYKAKFKLSLAFYLKNPKVDFESIIDSYLLPFNTPSQPINLFIWLWDLLFPNEDYFLISTEGIIEKKDQYEPMRLSTKPP